jgi:hypothetical protein
MIDKAKISTAPDTVFLERLARELIYDQIDKELETQLVKHGPNAIVFRKLQKQFSITAEEGLEAIEALTQHLLKLARGVNDDTELMDELIQLAACAIGMAVSLDLRKMGSSV